MSASNQIKYPSSLRFQILLPVIVTLVSLTFLVTRHMYSMMKEEVHTELFTRAKIVSNILAKSAQDSILNKDPSMIQGLIDEYKNIRGISYVYIIDENKQVVAHTFTPEFPKEFQSLAEHASASGYGIEQNMVTWNKKRYSDFSYPILAGTMGSAHVVMDEQQIIDELVGVLKDALVFSLLCGLGGVIAVYFFINRVILSIKKLSAVSSAIAVDGNLDLEIPDSKVGEISELSHHFKEMVSSLKIERETLENKVQERTKELNQTVMTLESTRQQLVTSSKMQALGEMAGGIAHEINNPITAIKMKSELLIDMIKEGGEVPQEMALASLERIIAMVARVSKIIKGLRAFSRNGEQDAFEKVLLNRIIEDTLTLSNQRMMDNGIELKVEPVPEIEIECREVQVSQVLLNLMNNASDAIAAKEKKWLKIDFKTSENRLEIGVMDCGDGIPASIRDKIMQPFFSTKPVGSGTGLGLSVSKGIIEDHDGTLTYDETSPHTRFVISLPLRQKPNRFSPPGKVA